MKKTIILFLIFLISCMEKKDVDHSQKVEIINITTKHIGSGYFDVILHFKIKCNDEVVFAKVNYGRGARYTGTTSLMKGDIIIVNYSSKSCDNFQYVRKVNH